MTEWLIAFEGPPTVGRQASVPPDTKLKLHFCKGFAKGFGVPWAKLQRFQINCTPYIHWTSPNQGWECESRSICIETTTLLWHSMHGLETSNLDQVETSTTPPHVYVYIYTVSTNIMKYHHAHIDTYILKYTHIYTYAQISSNIITHTHIYIYIHNHTFKCTLRSIDISKLRQLRPGSWSPAQYRSWIQVSLLVSRPPPMQWCSDCEDHLEAPGRPLALMRSSKSYMMALPFLALENNVAEVGQRKSIISWIYLNLRNSMRFFPQENRNQAWTARYTS